MSSPKRKYIFYTYSGGEVLPAVGLAEGYSLKVWKPSFRELIPKGLPKFPFLLWSLMQYFRFFRNYNYTIFLVYYEKKVAHYGVVLPKHFKYPFMDEQDMQIGPVGTNIEHRRKGLASFNIKKIVETYKKTGRKFWYITGEENAASRKLIESVGFLEYGSGFKKNIFGMGFLGSFYIENKY